MSFFDELKRRNVVRVGIAYTIAAWVLLQVLDVIGEILELPAWGDKLLLAIIVAGFFVTLFVAWAYELTPEGIKRESEVDRSASITRQTGHKLDRLIVVVLAIAVVLLAADRLWLASDGSPGHEAFVAAGQKSIAVLPFVNLSTDDDFFADGLSEELLNLLAKIPELKVAGRTSSFVFKNKAEDLRAIGGALGVATVLEGSVRRSGDRLRITAQLVNVEDGFHLWSETYDRQMADIFDIQDDVAGSIANALRLRLAPHTDRPTMDPDAYALYLRAVAMSSNVGDGNIGPIVELLDQALAIDPAFAKAHELKAMAYWLAGGWTLNAQIAQRYVHDSAVAALALDPTLPGAQAFAVSAAQENWSWAAEIEALEAAQQAAPNVSWLLDFLAYDYFSAGYLRESLELSERLIELEPLASSGYLRKANALSAMGDRESARQNWRRAYELGASVAGRSLAVDHFVAGEYEQAREWLRREPIQAIVEVDDIDRFFEGALAAEEGKAFVIEWVSARASAASDFETGHFAYAWLAYFGYIDEFWERVDYLDTATGASWDNSDVLVNRAMVFRRADIVTHPRFLPFRRADTMVAMWDERGPPDFCSKASGEWVCE